MTVASNHGVWLNYRIEGDGEPLLMIMGLGGSGRAWWRLLDHVTPHSRTIVMDNRGTGQSDRVGGPLRMRDLVADCIAVLDAAGEESAHVFGVSMGGMVAQHLALDHRDRVRSLILGCTTAAGGRGAPPWRMLGASALRPFLGPERTWPMLAPSLYAPSTLRDRRERVAEDLKVRVEDATPPRTVYAQMAAIAGHNTLPRLGELDGLGVTVIHGEQDALVPPARAAELARTIPGARLVMIPTCGHMLTTDAEDATAAAIVEHLARHASRSSSQAA